MNNRSHVILCGQISQYNKDVPYPPPLSDKTQETLQSKNITRERFLLFSHMDKVEAALSELSQWVKSGQIKVRRKCQCVVDCVGVLVCPKCMPLLPSLFLHLLFVILRPLCRCWKPWRMALRILEVCRFEFRQSYCIV